MNKSKIDISFTFTKYSKYQWLNIPLNNI